MPDDVDLVPAPSADQDLAATSFIVSLTAADYFPHAKGDLSPFDIDTYFTNYNADTSSWLSALDPHTGDTDEDKARLLTEAAYARRFDENDPDMVDDMQGLLEAVAGNTTTSRLTKRVDWYSLSESHPITWALCYAFFQCISGTTCSVNIDVGKAPRSRCEERGGQTCCMSWSSYDLRFGFLRATFVNCDSKVAEAPPNGKRAVRRYSCQGHGDRYERGDVCFSNRANGCT